MAPGRRRNVDVPQPAARRRPAGRAREPSAAERRVLQLIKQGNKSDMGVGVGHEESFFKALKTRKKHDGAAAIAASYDGYQAGENDKIAAPQNPPSKFPTALASVVMVFETDAEWRGEEQGISYAKMGMQVIVDKLRSADMIVREVLSTDKKIMYALISVSEKRQRVVAEIMENRQKNSQNVRVRMRKLDDEDNIVKNGGAWCSFRNDLYQYFEKSSEGTLFASCQQQAIMEFLINERDPRAMGPQCIQRNNILQQMAADERIKGYFNLHHPEKRKWLLKYWAGSYTSKQPIEDIREYFGEQIGLFFAFSGFIVTQLWVLAGLGIFLFAMGMIAYTESGSTLNPYMPLFALYVALWSINFSAAWKRTQLVLQYEWDLLDYEAPDDDRTQFVQNPKTYKRLNTVSSREEYFPDPIFRVLALIATFFVMSIVIMLTIGVVVMFAIIFKFIQDQLASVGVEIPGGFLVVFQANLQAALIFLFRWVFGFVANFLNDFENWRTEEQYQDALITKTYGYGFVNNFFPIIFVAFIANWVQPFGADVSCGNACTDYVVILVGVIYLQNAVVNAVITMFFSGSAPKSTEESQNDEVELSPAEIEDKLSQFGGLTEPYLDKMMELGYIMMFAAACPLLALFALINNIWSLRSLANKFLVTYQRFSCSCCRDIGTFTTIIDITSITAIIVNSSLIAFTSNTLLYYFPHMNEWDRVFYAVVCEHLLLFLKVLMDMWVDVPADVELAYKKKKYEDSVLREKFDDKDPEEDVAFYTSDDGPLYYPSKNN